MDGKPSFFRNWLKSLRVTAAILYGAMLLFFLLGTDAASITDLPVSLAGAVVSSVLWFIPVFVSFVLPVSLGAAFMLTRSDSTGRPPDALQ